MGAFLVNVQIEGHAGSLQRGGDLSRVASVASFFVSRIDSAVDAQLASVLKAHSTDPALASEQG